jgi:hypothetical protein
VHRPRIGRTSVDHAENRAPAPLTGMPMVIEVPVSEIDEPVAGNYALAELTELGTS